MEYTSRAKFEYSKVYLPPVSKQMVENLISEPNYTGSNDEYIIQDWNNLYLYYPIAKRPSGDQ